MTDEAFPGRAALNILLVGLWLIFASDMASLVAHLLFHGSSDG